MKKMLIFVVTMMLFLALGFLPSQGLGAEPASWGDSSNGLPTTGTYFGVTFGDMDNDGYQDIIAASDGDGVRVYLGDGTGSWTAVASHPTTSGGFGDVVVGDYDSDENLDIFVGGSGNSDSSTPGIYVFKGDGDGGFTDVSASSNLPTQGKWRGVAVDDVNGDGNIDLAATSGYGSSYGIHVYTGDGTGTFTDNSVGLPGNENTDSSVIFSDFNNDGDLDVATGGYPGVSVYLGNGGSGGAMSWSESSSGLPSERFTGVKAADVDNDGSMDLVISSYDAGSGVGLRAYRNVNNAASWSSASTGLPTEGEYIELSAADFDEDGNIDLITGGVLSYGGIRVYYGDGTGTWTEDSGGLPTSGDRIGTEVKDVTGDGKPDAVVGRFNGGGLEFWKNLGSELTPPTIQSTSPGNSETNIPINTGISITFSRGMDTTTTGNAISTSPDITVSSSWSAGNSVVTFTPSANLETSYLYTITISTNARSANGINLESSYEFSFTTGSNVDVTPPSIVSSNPSDNANNVAVRTEVIITFSESMNAAVTESAISISEGSIIERSWANGGTELTLTVSLEADTTHTLTISSNAQDLAGNNIQSGYSFSFTTASSDRTPSDKSDSSELNPLFLILPVIIVVIILVILMAKKKG